MGNAQEEPLELVGVREPKWYLHISSIAGALMQREWATHRGPTGYVEVGYVPTQSLFISMLV